MNAMTRAAKTILNAMAFANAGNDSECRALLGKLNDTDLPEVKPAQPGLTLAIGGRAVMPAPIHPAQRAL